MKTYTAKQYDELNKKILDTKLDIIQLLSEIQEYDDDFQIKNDYLKYMNLIIKKSEDKLIDMGLIIQSNFLKTYLTEEQINNVKIICNDSEGEDVD